VHGGSRCRVALDAENAECGEEVELLLLTLCASGKPDRKLPRLAVGDLDAMRHAVVDDARLER